ncbi:hypothetical protein LJR143_001683 [Pseudoxanthomonas sp. LjRoot143]|uniref:hypothetical protein n=1 Tax=Pseudoxanthomonas sp. LjRoot143 TaxID=3342266 RepID=UPI003ECE12D8
MSDPNIIPVADVPITTPGSGDHVVGAQLGATRGFRVGGPHGIATLDESGNPRAPTALVERISTLELGQSAGMLGFETRALMNADLAHVAGTLALVTNDATAANNGTYRKTGASGSGSWELSADRVSLVSQELNQRIRDSAAVIFAVADDDGYAGFKVTAKSISNESVELSDAGVQFGNEFIGVTEDFALAVADKSGFIGFAITKTGEALLPSVGTTPGAGEFSQAEINALNAVAHSSVRNALAEFNTEVARPVWDYNHFIMYGQSLSTGQEGWPALSKVGRHGNLMLGNCSRPLSGSSAGWTSVGGVDVLQPLVAAVQDGAGAVMSDAAVAALAPGAQNLGEDPLVEMVNFAKHQHNLRLMVVNDTAHTFVGTSCGVSGKTIEQLGKGAAPELYLRMTEASSKVSLLASGQGKSYGVVGVAFLQGEYNYVTDFGGATSKAAYKANLSDLYDDIEADVVNAIAGQSAPPLFVTYQTGAAYTRDADGLSIGMAQWELSQERRNWVLACPVYPYTDKGGHMDANGYRWIGAQFGKVWHRVVALGQDWKPLSPISAIKRSREILISFHVPVAPLTFDLPYVQTTATDFPFKGFEVLDVNGNVTISSIAIIADSVVKIALAEDTDGTVQVRYAGKDANNGHGCLRDSDPTVADASYVYEEGTGQYPAANIPALVGKPYPLHNWCVAFQIPVLAG